MVLAIIIVLASISFFFWIKFDFINHQPRINKDKNENVILSELERLNIQTIGSSKQIQLKLPSMLSDANWEMKKIVCEEGGYDLSFYSNKTLLFTYYPINEVWDNTEPLNVWIVSDNDKVVCVYKAVREDSIVIPGIFSVKENPNINKK